MIGLRLAGTAHWIAEEKPVEFTAAPHRRLTWLSE
jgi:hypothetical protein